MYSFGPLSSRLKWLTPEPFLRLARQTHWLKRQGRINAFEFLWSMVLGQASALRLTLSAQGNSLSTPVTRQAIHDRFLPSAVDYFKASFDYCFTQLLDQAPTPPMAAALLAHVDAVHLVDSTSFDCPASMQDLFPACGGDASPANMKVLLSYEFIRGTFHPLRVLEGKASDQGLAKEVAQTMEANHLYLQDKGFFSSALFTIAQERKAFVLAPFPHSVTLWLPAGLSGVESALDLAGELAATSDNQCQWPNVYLGQGPRRTPLLRVVAFRLSPESAGRQRAKLREGMRRQGRQPTQKALELAGWLILVTNADAQKLPSSVLSYLYRLRWQVELIFRVCKWVLRLDQTQSDNPCRVQCEFWARLLAALLIFNWHAHANAASWKAHHSEISFEKLARMVQQSGHTLIHALFQGPAHFGHALSELWGNILKNARKERQLSRTNTWDSILENWLESPASTASGTTPM
jgi:hypothetical protein